MQERANDGGVSVELVSRVQLRAVFCGVAVAVGVLFVCVGISWAIGLSTFAPTAKRATGLALGLLIWSAIALWIATFAGGWVAAIVGRTTRSLDGILHGLAVWGTAAAVIAAVSLGLFVEVMNALFSLTGASNMAARAGVIPPPSVSFDVQLVVAKMAREFGVVLWMEWAGVAGGLLAAIAGGWLGAHGVVKATRRQRREVPLGAPAPQPT